MGEDGEAGSEMNDLEKQNSLIVAEANKILYDRGFFAMLSKYGNPAPTGSYMLGLMTWRDLDIYLESDEMTVGRFFQLGAEIASAIRPQRMHFRNEFLGKTPGLPLGFYWGIYVSSAEFPEEWKIDVWSVDSEQAKRFQKSSDDLRASINEKSRLVILEIKSHFYNHPEYRRGFGSVDIYQAVIEKGIRSVEDFAGWLQEHRGLSL